MKISELNANTFLNTSGAPDNSYLLINYAAGQGVAPSTQKTSLNTIAKAIAAELNLPIAVTDGSNNITGFKKVSIAGNSYQMTDLAANLGGGGNSGSEDSGSGFIPNEAISVYYQHEGDSYDAYPLFYVPDNGQLVVLNPDISTENAVKYKYDNPSFDEISSNDYYPNPSGGGGS